MLVIIVAHLAPSGDAGSIFTGETLSDTGAAVMTAAEARAAGFGGLPEYPPNVRIIAVQERDKRRIINAIEASPAVSNFSVHDVDA